MVVSERIKAIADFINPGERIADIGADHGILELYLIAKYDNIFVTAIENKIGPYQNLDRNLKGLKNVRLSLSDGLTGVDRKTKTIVIAGMGGINIKNIIRRQEAKLNSINKIIIDAHRDRKIAIKEILKHSFKIKTEKIVFEQDKFYVISVLVKCLEKINYSKDELDFGYKLYKDPLWDSYRQYLIEKNELTINRIGTNENQQDKVLKLKKLNERLNNYGKN